VSGGGIRARVKNCSRCGIGITAISVGMCRRCANATRAHLGGEALHGTDPNARFLRYVSPEPTSGCWLWAKTLSRFGYGMFRIKRESYLAHRYSWTLHRGPIPVGLWVLHRCDVPACVNPGHLFLGTHQDNMDDMKRKGRGANSHTKAAQPAATGEGAP